MQGVAVLDRTAVPCCFIGSIEEGGADGVSLGWLEKGEK
jgi:hypothetical protein